MSLTSVSLKKPVTTLMIFTCFMGIGAISAWLLPLEFLPDLDIPYVRVEIPYPGSTPDEIEQEITRPAEEVLATISGIKRMESNTGEDEVDIELEFDWGVDSNIKALEIKEKLDGVRHLLPQDLERFYVYRFSPADMQMIQLRISSNHDLSNAYDMLDRNLKRRIDRLEGVSKVELYGVEKKQIRIQLIADRIISHHIDIGRLSETLQRSNFLITAGKITDSDHRFLVRPIGELRTIEELGDLFIGKGNLRLRDVADIKFDHPELNYGRHLNRRYAVGLDVYKEAGANTVDVADRVIAEVETISKIPEMEGISIFYMDNTADGIVSSLNELLKSGLLGGSLAIFVLFFFLRRFSTTFIVALAVPFSLLITMAFMYFMGLSLNILTMMGLMLAVGMLVDNAVVVTESIHRHQLKNHSTQDSIKTGVSEVAMAITAGTMTTAIVFLPNIVSPNDQIAVYMKHVGMTICIALGASLLLAQTVVPLLASKTRPPDKKPSNTVIDKLLVHYGSALNWTLRHRRASIGIILLVLVSVALPISTVKMEMFDEPSDRRLYLRYNIDGFYALEKVIEAVDVYENYLFTNQDKFDIESVYTYYTGEYAMSTILLTKDEYVTKSMDDIKDAINENLPRVPIADPTFGFRGRDGDDQSVNIQLTGKSSEQLAEISHDIAWTLSKVEGLTDVRSGATVGKEEIHVRVDRVRARKYGFSPGQVANIVSTAMRGMNLRRFRTEHGEIDVRLEFQDSDRQTLEQLRNLPLFNGGEQPVKLATLADFSVQRGPREIERVNRVTSIDVTANLKNLTISEAKEKIGKVLTNYNFPPGYSWSYGQSFDEEDEAFKRMVINLLLALALIYFVMASIFESLVYPAAIWTQILFAIVGVYWFYLITGTTMSLMGMIGILILIGVVVNNGIVLIDHVNRLRFSGLDRRQAILQAGQDRLRPILMTAGTTILSLVPLCIVTTQIGGNGPPYFPMARAIVGGLSFSTAVTLLILPTVYIILDDLRIWSRKVVRMSR